MQIRKFIGLTILSACIGFAALGWAGQRHASPWPVRPQTAVAALDELLLQEDFESYEVGILPAGWQQVDGDGGYSSWFQRESVWQTFARESFSAHSGIKMVMCHYNNQAVPNDDWLILPQMNAAGTITLSYWAASQDANYPESFEVRVSTTGTDPSDFSTLIYTNGAVPEQWNAYSHDLSAFAGTPFYIAFHYNSVNRFVLKLDDIALDGTSLTGAVAGYITDDSARAISGAYAEISALSRTARTDSSGRYVLPFIPPGNHNIRYYHEYYDTEFRPGIAVAISETSDVNVSLEGLDLEFLNCRPGNVPQPITDFDTANAFIIISETLIVYDLDVTISIDHPFIGDLKLWLVTPDTTLIPLVALNPFNNSQNMTDCRFDDEAVLPFTAGAAPYTGHWRPLQPLSVLDGDSSLRIRGAQRFRRWDLFVYDSSAQDEGQLVNFTIQFVSAMGAIAGIVRNGGDATPISDVQVYAAGRRTRDSTSSDAAGQYSLSRMGMGIVSVTFTKDGYDTVRIDGVSIYPDSTRPLDVSLNRIVSTDNLPLFSRSFRFDGNYPNPFNAHSEFRFSLANAGDTQLILYNILGQPAAVLVNESLVAGEHRIAFSAGGLPSGLYFARLVSSGLSETRKVILLK